VKSFTGDWQATLPPWNRIKGSQEIYYPGAPHGLTATHADRVNSDLLKFFRQDQQAQKAA
jgi:non-heme chloroperoxidase